jgi:hypothetical protein
LEKLIGFLTVQLLHLSVTLKPLGTEKEIPPLGDDIRQGYAIKKSVVINLGLPVYGVIE